MKEDSISTTAIILSGGAGIRFNGADKGLVKLDRRLLIEHVLDRITPQVDEVIICANRNIESYQVFANIVCKDSLTDEDTELSANKTYQGPMAGISAALRKHVNLSSASAVLISSCDTPKLPNDLKQRLETGLSRNPNMLVAVAHDGNRSQNLHCLIQRDAWESLIDFFDNGGRAMHRWLKKIGVHYVDFSDCPESFENYNTQQQLESNGNNGVARFNKIN